MEVYAKRVWEWLLKYSHRSRELFSYTTHDSLNMWMQFNINDFFTGNHKNQLLCVTYSLIQDQVGITEQDLSSCSGKVPKLQQLLMQRGFLYGKTKVTIGALRVKVPCVQILPKKSKRKCPKWPILICHMQYYKMV